MRFAPVSAATLVAADSGATENPEAHKLPAYPMLDWLRFALASGVVLEHLGISYGPLGGSLWVSVFLSLSGWLIGGILLKSESGELPRFFYNRATRIWAPYFAAIFLLYTTAALREGIDANWFKYLFYDVTFTHYNFTEFPRASLEMPLKATGNMFWSLAVEEQFYLAAPLLMLFTRWGKSTTTWGVISLALMAGQSIAAPVAAGVFAAALDQRHSILSSTAWRVATIAITVASAVALFWMNVQPFRSLFSIGVVLMLATPGKRSAAGKFFGAISFPLYLNQWVGGFSVAAFSKYVLPVHPLFGKPLAYLAGILVAVAAWYIVDRTVMLYRDGWYTPTRGRALGVTAYLLVTVGLIGGNVLRTLGQ